MSVRWLLAFALVLLAPAAVAVDFTVLPAHLEIDACITLINEAGRRVINDKEGVFVLTNPDLRDTESNANLFTFFSVGNSGEKKEIELPPLIEQRELFQILTQGLMASFSRQSAQVGQPVKVHLILKKVQAEIAPAVVGVNPYGVQVASLGTRPAISLEKGFITIAARRLMGQQQTYRHLGIHRRNLGTQIGGLSDFYMPHGPEVYRYFIPYTEGRSYTPIFPIGEDASGNLLFVSEQELIHSLNTGDDVPIYSDSSKLAQRVSPDRYRWMNRVQDLVSLRQFYYQSVASLHVYDRGWDDVSEALRKTYLTEALRRLRRLATARGIIYNAGRTEIFMAHCERVIMSAMNLYEKKNLPLTETAP